MPDLTAERRRDLLALLLIVFVAALMRFGRGDVVEYFHDDAILSTLALELSDGLRFPFIGILSSTGIPNPPISVYFMAIPFALSTDPVFAIHFVMFWNVIGVALLCLLARHFFGWRTALIAGLAYAVNPWAVLFSRKIWTQDLHSPWILLGLLLLLYGFWGARDGTPRRRSVFVAQSLSVPLLVIGFQFHFAAWALLPLIPLVIFTARKRIIRRALVIGFALSILVISPYLLGLSQTLQADPTRISDALMRSSVRGPQLSIESISALIRLASGSGLETWLAPDQQAQLAASYPPLTVVTLTLLPMVAFGIHAALQRSRRMAIFLLIWAFLPVLLLLVEWTPVYVHYFIPSIPAMMFLVGLGADSVFKIISGKRILQSAVWLFVAIILTLQFLQWRAALDFVANRHVPYPGFTTPLGRLLPLRDRLAEADDVVVVAGGMSWNLHHEVAVWDTLLWDSAGCVRTVVSDGYAVFPSHPFTAVFAPDAGVGPLFDLYRRSDPETFATRQGNYDYELYTWEEAPSWSGVAINPVEWQLFDNGVRLIRLRLGR